MKRLKALFCFFLLLILAGCCKEMCIGNEIVVSFEKLKAIDTDTVLVIKYQPGTQLVKGLDTARIYSNVAPTDTSNSRVFHTITAGFDWKILVPSVNKTYTVTGFILTKQRCPCGGNTYQSIEAYSVNNVRKEGFFISLD
jgi:hypothetical protein